MNTSFAIRQFYLAAALGLALAAIARADDAPAPAVVSATAAATPAATARAAARLGRAREDSGLFDLCDEVRWDSMLGEGLLALARAPAAATATAGEPDLGALAAAVLLLGGDPRGDEVLAARIEAPVTRDEALAALARVAGDVVPREGPREPIPPRLAAALKGALRASDPAAPDAARRTESFARLAARLRLADPEGATRLLGAIPATQPYAVDVAGAWLARVSPRAGALALVERRWPEVIRAAEPRWQDELEPHETFSALAEAADVTVRARVQELTVARLDRLAEASRFREAEAHVSRLAEHGDAGACPALLRVVSFVVKDADPRGTGMDGWKSGLLQAALRGLARIDGAGAAARPLGAADHGNSIVRREALLALSHALAGTGDANAAARLSDPAAPLFGDVAVLALLRVGGEAGRTAARTRAKASNGDVLARMEAAWALDGIDAARMRDRLVALGGYDAARPLPSSPPLSVLARWPRASEPERAYDRAVRVLRASRLGLASFDVEADEYPCRYEKLVSIFAEASCGAFLPSAVRQTLDPEPAKDTPGAPPRRYTVEIDCGATRYRARPRENGDWYDPGPIVRAVDTALADAGREERVHALPSNGQFATILFAPTRTAEILATEFHVPVRRAALAFGDAEAEAGRAAEALMREALGGAAKEPEK